MKTTRVVAPAVAAVLILTGGCSFMQGVGEVGEATGGAVGDLLRKTGAAVKNAARRAQERNDRRARSERQVVRRAPSRTVYSQTAQVSGSPELSSAQTILNRRGYNAGYPDGLMGRKTRRALREFQQDQGLAVTGRLDDATLLALRNSTDADNRPARPRPVVKTKAATGRKKTVTKAATRPGKAVADSASQDAPAKTDETSDAATRPEPASLGRARILSDTEMKTAADPFSTDVQVLKKGVTVNLIGKTSDWYKAEYQGRTGYVFAEFVGR